MSRPRILAFAYACEPGVGSEPGAGWAWANLLAGIGDTWVLTRANNRDAIEAAGGVRGLRFEYVDLPAWARRWKRGPRGVRLYSLLWQVGALRRAFRLRREIRFDLVWHLTLANAWLGSLAPLAGAPFVYGPVGGGAGTPANLRRTLGARGAVEDHARSIARCAGRWLNPFARLAWRRARLILAQNPETVAWLPSRYRGRAVVAPNPVLAEPLVPRLRPWSEDGEPTALFAGRLVPWKGARLAVQAAALAGWRVLIAGDGPERDSLEALADRLGSRDQITFLGRQPRHEVLRIMRERADVLLFPSLHDEAGWVVMEAVASGLPVVCLDRGGPPVLGGSRAVAVEVGGRERDVVRRLAAALPEAAALPPAPVAGRRFSLETRRAEIRLLLGDVGLPGGDVVWWQGEAA